MPTPVPSPSTSVVTTPKTTKSTRRKNGQFEVGNPGFPGGAFTDAARARRALNGRFLAAMIEAFERGGKQAIEKTMKQSPAIFVKMLTLLVPRELEVTHSNVVKQMSDEQIEAAIEHIQQLLKQREAGIIDVTPEPAVADQDVGADVGRKRKVAKRRVRSTEERG